LLAQKLHHDPAGFEEARAQHEGPDVQAWEWGHGPPQLTLALEKLHVGEVAPEPVAIPYFFVVPMRLDPAWTADADPRLDYELPLRAAPDLKQLFHDADSASLAPRIAEFTRPEVNNALALTAHEEAAFHSTLEALQRDLQAAGTADARVRSYEVAVKRLHESLSEAVYSKIMAFFEQEAARTVLANP
jgi:hypothetical protein